MLLSNGLKIDIEPLQKLRYCLTVPEIIAFPVTNEEFILETNVNYSFWAVLSQVQNDQERIVSYASRTTCMIKVDTIIIIVSLTKNY